MPNIAYKIVKDYGDDRVEAIEIKNKRTLATLGNIRGKLLTLEDTTIEEYDILRTLKVCPSDKSAYGRVRFPKTTFAV